MNRPPAQLLDNEHEETHPGLWNRKPRKEIKRQENYAYLAEEEYLVTALVPSETACLASSPGRINRTLLSVRSIVLFIQE